MNMLDENMIAEVVKMSPSPVNTTDKFVRIILDLEKCNTDKLTPFVRLGMDGFDRKEIIVAQHIIGSTDLYIATATWPHDVMGGRLEVGKLGCGDRMGVQLEDKHYSVLVDQDMLIYIPWGNDLEEIQTGEAGGQYVALFVNECSTVAETIGVLGNIEELGQWDPDSCSLQTILDAKPGLSLCSVPLDAAAAAAKPGHLRNIRFKLVTLTDEAEEQLHWEGPVDRFKKAQLSADIDIVVWSRWGENNVQTTRVHPASDLTILPRHRAPQPATEACCRFRDLQGEAAAETALPNVAHHAKGSSNLIQLTKPAGTNNIVHHLANANTSIQIDNAGADTIHVKCAAGGSDGLQIIANNTGSDVKVINYTGGRIITVTPDMLTGNDVFEVIAEDGTVTRSVIKPQVLKPCVKQAKKGASKKRQNNMSKAKPSPGAGCACSSVKLFCIYSNCL